MVPGAWPDPWREGDHERPQVIAARSSDSCSRSFWRKHARSLGTMMWAVGWPSLFVVGIALPDRLEAPRALVLSAALSLFVLERLETARTKRNAEQFAAFARAMDAEDALASTVFVVSERAEAIRPLHAELEPVLPPRAWRPRQKRALASPPKRPPWPPLPPRVPLSAVESRLGPLIERSLSERTTTSAPLTRLPRSQRPTVPESMQTIHVDLLERSRRES